MLVYKAARKVVYRPCPIDIGGKMDVSFRDNREFSLFIVYEIRKY